jgi:hypothetical protein
MKKKEKGKNQNLPLFKRGYLISGTILMIGRNQLPKPPIKEGMTKKKIMRRA